MVGWESSIGAVILAVYGATTAPTIVGGDAGELVAESCHLGTAHPPGYPLFTLLMHVATMWVPPIFGTASTDTSAATASASNVFAATPAARANLLNAVFGAAAGAIVARTVVICVRDLGFSLFCGGKVDGNAKLADWGAGAAAAAFYAFSPLVWLYASTAEVFALNNFLCALMLERAATFAVSGTVGDACLGAFVVGLALGGRSGSGNSGAPQPQLAPMRCGAPVEGPAEHLQ